MGRLNKNKDFYNSISSEYDSMINSSAVIKSRKEILKKFIDDDFRDAADIGCGTGNDSVALSMNGLNVTGFEPSEEMMKIAMLNAAYYKQNIKFVNASAGKISRNYYGKFDFAISLGNTVANIKPSELRTSFLKAYSILREKGSFLVQVLNYENARKENKRVVNITGNAGKLFLRFYDFHSDRLDFNILSINKNNPKEYDLITTQLHEYGKNELTGLLRECGFGKVICFGDFAMNSFSRASSKDLIILAKK